MNENKTSQIAAKILRYIEANDVVTWHAMADKNLREILQRSQRMEEALEKIEDLAGVLECRELADERPCIACITDQALSYDPLSE